MRHRSRSPMPYKNARSLAPLKGDILDRIFVTIVLEDQLSSNLAYYKESFLPKFGVQALEIGNHLVAAIIDKEYAWKRLRTEKRWCNGTEIRWCSGVSVRLYIPFT